jgi:microcin C transport system substrate-binding protein
MSVNKTGLYAFFCLLILIPPAAWCDNVTTTYGFTLYGKLKYGPGFKHFDYVNPDAPKGGSYTVGLANSFDSLNPFITLGNAIQQFPIISMLTYDSLMIRSGDEPASVYGLIAKSITTPADYSWVEFKLRKSARWHDGTPITPDDVIFSLHTLKTKGSPQYRNNYAEVDKVEKTGPYSVRFVFSETGNRGLVYTVAQMPVLPKHYWQGRKFDEPTLDPPLTSGPYRITRVDPGHSLTFQRVKDYWARDLPVMKGRFNFGSIRYDWYRDTSVLYEAFMAGNTDLRWETLPNQWVNGYKGQAVQKGYIKKEMLDYSGTTFYSGYFFNLRKKEFQDQRVREAIANCFDFQWINKNIFHGQYKRVSSYFENSELAARGKPSPAELKLLEPYRDRLDPRVFNQPLKLPTTDGTQASLRQNLRRAVQLLREAGYTMQNGKQISPDGKPLQFQILLWDPFFKRATAPFVDNLKRIGVKAKMRLVDTAEWTRRMRDFDYEMTQGFITPMPLSPGSEQREIFGSKAAGEKGSRNQTGIKNPVVDALIGKIIHAPDRIARVAATRAMDRVLLWNYYSIPTWYAPGIPIAYWDRFGRPATEPSWLHIVWIMSNWWIDPDKAAAVQHYLESRR